MADLTTQANIDEANVYCERLARSHYENFSVVSWAFPKRLRRSMYSVYAYCRYTDDLGDEAEGDRLALIDAWEADLHRCYDGTPEHPILQALQQTIHQHDIPIEPFLNLIESERLDQRVKRHPTYEDLLRYCAHSAAPVGRMVLYVFGYRDQERQRLSDATCNALQLANFWQDVKRDYAMGRIYIPQEDMERFGYAEEDLAAGLVTPAFQRLIAFEVERARALFDEGAKLVDMVAGELRLDLKLFTEGGLAVLDAIQRQGYDVLTRRPVVSKGKKTRLVLTGFAKLAAQRLMGRGHG